MTSIISEMYKDIPDKKDGAYTVFYMGVNAGAFLGIMLCGYMGEKVGWSWGFGLAGIFMFLGMLQFYFAQNIFGEIGKRPIPEAENDLVEDLDEGEGEGSSVPFGLIDKISIIVMTLAGLIWIFNDPLSKIYDKNMLDFSVGGMDGSNFTIVAALIMFLVLLIYRILQYNPVVRDRMIAVAIFAFFTIFFWAAFEQAGGSMTIFAKDYTNRTLEGGAATSFKIFNTLLTVVPLGIITWVLWQLFQKIFKEYAHFQYRIGLVVLLLSGESCSGMIYREFSVDTTRKFRLPGLVS